MVGCEEEGNNKEKHSKSNNSYGSKSQQKCLKKLEKQTQYLNHGKEDQMEIEGYEKCWIRTSCTYLLYFLTLGTLRLIYHWFPRMRLFSTHRLCCLEAAEKVLIMEHFVGKHKLYFVKDVKHLSATDERMKIDDKVGKMTVHLDNGTRKEMSELKVIWVKKLCYVWDSNNMNFFKLVGLDAHNSCADLHTYSGLSELKQALQRIAYGTNLIHVPVDKILVLLCLEVLTPFYIFQMMSITLWLLEGYYYYNLAIVIMSVFGISSSIIQTRRNQVNLQGTVQSVGKVSVCRGKTPNDEDLIEEIETSELVPGDVIIIPRSGFILQSDCVLLKGGTCIVNESMLTGESMPVTKTPLPNTSTKIFDVKHDTNHTLFCGTKIIQTRQYGDQPVKAVVIRTGYLTAKGQLVRSILYPPPVDFKFDQDSYVFIGILAAIAFCGFVFAVILKSSRGMPVVHIIIKSLDLFTICIPPALPAAMTVGKIYALNRLKEKQIFCINSRIINVSGSINCACFDKTGTLTEDGLDLWGVIGVGKIQDPTTRTTKVVLTKPVAKPSESFELESPLLLGMVTCHSITNIDNELCGDPLDVKMFEATNWTLDEKSGSQVSLRYGLNVQTVFTSVQDSFHEIGVVHQFQFSSNLQRMSVIAKRPNEENFTVFCKGSPEKIIALSKPATVPDNIAQDLQVYTKKGYRVIALATKVLKDVPSDIKNIERDDVERDLEFVGLLILDNRLKPQTTGVIDILKRADVKIVMITGDNIQTAISVARECGMIEKNDVMVEVSIGKSEKNSEEIIYDCHDDQFQNIQQNTYFHTDQYTIHAHLNQQIAANKPYIKYAMSGEVWNQIKEKFPDQLPRFVKNGIVFARMSSDQKQQLILELQSLGYYVAMCGDGANDCGALKAAHAGISLSDTEASVASPFTSKIADISCVPKVIREGRAALVTSFGIFKFMVAYALTEFSACIVLYTIDSNLTDIEFLYIDVALIINFAFFFGRTHSYQGPLHNVPPPNSLLSLVPLLSLSLQLISYTIFQIIALLLVMRYTWYVPFVFDLENQYYFGCQANYAVFSVSLFQYIIMTIAFSFGKPYRKAIYTNSYLMLTIAVTFALNVFLILYPTPWLANAFDLVMPPSDFRYVCMGLVFANFVVSIVLEDLVVNMLVTNFAVKRKKSVKAAGEACLETYSPMGISNLSFVDENGHSC